MELHHQAATVNLFLRDSLAPHSNRVQLRYAFLVSQHSGLFVVGWLETGWLFEDIQERSRAIESVALRISHPFYDLRPFESFDGALRGRKRDFQFVGRTFYRDEGICPQKFDHTQRVVA